MKALFHLALPTNNLNAMRNFFTGVLKAELGRTGPGWLDVNLFGHQITVQEVGNSLRAASDHFHPSLGYPLRHFGVILEMSVWNKLSSKLTEGGVPFTYGPEVLMPGEIGEQKIFMITDPDGNVWEFKGFDDLSRVFSV
ncbi:MAG: hypothetical protein RL226_1741 [Bacteroidota bacterium]|jgi:extradiol dioxygenase family protein